MVCACEGKAPSQIDRWCFTCAAGRDRRSPSVPATLHRKSCPPSVHRPQYCLFSSFPHLSLSLLSMSSSSPLRPLSTTPFFPGAWPSPLRNADNDHDADVSSVSSYGSLSAAHRGNARRRWTYAGSAHPHGHSSTPSLRCPGSAGGSVSNEDKTSPLTEHTVSTALSSPLNTPDLADWPTRLGGSQSLLLDNFVSPSGSPHPVTRYTKTSPPRRGIGTSTYRPRFSSGTSRIHNFPSPHLDPPLLNFIPGLPPLKLPLPDISVEFPYQEFPSPTSPRRTHEHYPVTPASPRGQSALSFAYVAYIVSIFDVDD
ncbi:hypothetical protein L226DRAFT_32704 [Lentinus tigrinus ALCF2SS1-7]|uniref:uncharacterized protein n=1 Tax=Lentinus tigrinus ALCF2SS1-7 TaxID=1328758 RepID=UPI001165F36F|nr:hypothetical protein L226DRAFT_32704 [Lentinus tigrinus ALCF2SS1-7]